MVRWLIPFAVGIAGTAQAQVNQDAAAAPTPSAAEPATRVDVPGLKLPGLRDATRLRVRTLDRDKISSFLEADQMSGNPDTTLTMTGHAEVRRINGVVKGDRIDYDRLNDEVTVTGNVRMMQDTITVVGPSGHLNLGNDQGEIEKPDFWIGATGGTAQAEHADIFSKSEMRLKQVTYSGCPCAEPAWYIKADSLDIDLDDNEGVAHNGVLYFKDVPILASPYLSFPVKKERKSGFLAPLIGTSTSTGLDVSLPYYFNLAPNYDMTLTPRLLAKRGEMLGVEGRYLGSTYTGLLQGTYMPDDRVADRDRWMYRWQHFQQLGNGFYADWDVTRVSDDSYYRDITTMGTNTAQISSLPASFRVGWGDNYWQASVQTVRYQTLQDPTAPIAPQFDELPIIKFSGHRYDWNGFDSDWDTTAVRFSRPLLNGSRLSPNGDRVQTYPQVSYPIVQPGWFVTPKFGLNYTQYSTAWYGTDFNGLGSLAPYQTTQSRTVPIASVDSGIFFDRPTTFFGRDATQTLEPRLYYLYIPYRNQSALPVYDTYVGDFNFDQAFQENAYVGGWDRINNANQLTAALTTRWVDNATGIERLSLSVGQRLYFADQLVTLPGEVARTNRRSDYLAGASAALTDTLSTDVGAQYDPYQNQVGQAYTSLRWTPQRLSTIAVTYRYQRQPIINTAYLPTGHNQVSLGFQWPFTKHWYGIGRIDYSLGSATVAAGGSRISQAIAGIEYKGNCCWTGRVVAQRYAISSTQNNTAIFFQLELSGLGALGSDPMGLVRQSIPGYESVMPEQPPGTSFERYE
jgi:LPS-assembly protein